MRRLRSTLKTTQKKARRKLAKHASSPSQAKTNNNHPLIPKPTDPRAELFYLLGVLKGQNVEGFSRIAELVIDLTAMPVEEG